MFFLTEAPLFSPHFANAAQAEQPASKYKVTGTRSKVAERLVLEWLLHLLFQKTTLATFSQTSLFKSMNGAYFFPSPKMWFCGVLKKGISLIPIAHPGHGNDLEVTLFSQWMLSLFSHVSQVHYPQVLKVACKTLHKCFPNYPEKYLWWKIWSTVKFYILYCSTVYKKEKQETYLGPY